MPDLRVVGPGDGPPPDRDGWQTMLDDLVAMHGQVGELRAEATLIEGVGELRAVLISLDDAITRAAALVQTRMRQL